MKYKISEYAKLNKVTYRTVWAWVKSGKVQSELTTTGRILIVDNEVRKQTVVCIYCRVSSSENKSNLDSQADRMIAYANARGYKVDKVIKEVGNRLTRFGFNYIKTLFVMQNRKIEVVNQVIDEREDLIADFTSIITSFYARIYGQRRTKRKTEQLIKKLQDK